MARTSELHEQELERKDLRAHAPAYYESQLLIPEEVKKPGYLQGWCRFKTAGTHSDKFERAIRKGWRPVENSRDSFHDTSWEDPDKSAFEKKYICRNDVVLVEIEKFRQDDQEQFIKGQVRERRLSLRQQTDVHIPFCTYSPLNY